MPIVVTDGELTPRQIKRLRRLLAAVTPSSDCPACQEKPIIKTVPPINKHERTRKFLKNKPILN